ncbi:MAG TPA: tetratricopeptide repeat protein, partial [Tepidisphaeraceae bacterium]
AADRERLQSEALSRASKAAQQYREIAAASLLYAQLLHQAQSYNEAIEQYDQTLDKLPTNIDALRGAVQCLIATDRIPAARRRLDEGLAIAPNDPSLQQISMNLEISQGDPAKAIEALEKNVQANPDNLAAWAQLGTGLEQAASNKASKNEVDAAKAFLQRAADHWAKASEKFPTDLRFASATADVQRRLGNPRAAEEIFEKLAASDVWKDKPDVTRELASQYVRSGKPDQAEQVLQAYLERDKTLPTPVLLQLSVLYAQQQRADAALALLALKPDDPAVQRYRIELLVAANDLPTARVAIEEALAKNPTPEIQLIAAFVELRSSRFEQADGFISAVLKVRPNDAAALFYRSQVRLNLNPPQVEGAKEDLRRVSELTPNNIEARLSLAELLLQSNDREGAIRELERAWAVNNANKLVFLRLMDAYAGASPPRLADQQQVLNQAKASPQLAADADVLLVEANLTLARGDTRRAQEQAKAFKAAGANNPGVKERYYDLLLRAKAYRDLLAESEADLKDDRGAWQIYRLRGIAYRRQDQRLEAQREFDAAYNLVSAAGNWQGVALVVNTIAQELGVKLAISKVEPLAKSDLEARMLLTSLYERDNNLPAALAQVERTLADRPRLDPRQLDSALQAAGSLYLRMNPPMSEKARQVYEELSQRYPDDLALLNNLASVMGMPGSGGTPQKAVEYSTKAYDLSLKLPEGTLTPYIWDTHGWLLVQTGKVSEGIDLLRKAADTAKFPDAHLHLAEALMLQKDFDGAAQALEQAGQLADTMARENKPLDPSIRPKLERLTAELEAKRGTASVVN